MADTAPVLDAYELTDRYTRTSGRVFLSGTQALVRVAVTQRRLDRLAGLDTAGFVTGYRGSPLGGVDQALWQAETLLDNHDITFLPAVNEELAATAILGTQQVETDPRRQVQGVFGIWYGKGPGVDRAGDALKHGNAYGSSPHGGVLVVAGDDHGAVSSSMPHQSDVAFLTFFMPHLNPADVSEYLTYGLYGIALSRFSGMWVGFKAVSETVESARSVLLPDLPRFQLPIDFIPPPDGLHYRWPDLPGPQIEERLQAKKEAVLAFARANPIDRATFGVADARYGIVTTGKAHLDLMEALRVLRIDCQEARRIGLEVYKVGMVWPLEPRGALDFVRNKREVLVVEEKRGIIESWFKESFYDYPGHKPERMVGKSDEHGRPLIPWIGELTPQTLAPIVARRIDAILPGLDLTSRAEAIAGRPGRTIEIPGANRRPYFCSGCPHSTSTRVPEGSRALAGIGCHFMASWMGRNTESLIQMGGEGVNWITKSRYCNDAHVFQNLGDGTFYHSGSMAIRQAVAAGTNITYKILYNDAVAMTGGQPVDGPISVYGIIHQVRAEGVERIALVSDQPRKFSPADLPRGVTLHPRDQLDAVQRELRTIPGVTVIVYEQMCATEKRRRRKRGQLPPADGFVMINESVCEGCGDCVAASNCLSVVPAETPLGRKRQIDQNSCNFDTSCVDGFCPSFVTITGARRRTGVGDAPDIADAIAALPQPDLPDLGLPYDLLITGVGGTGVVTVGTLVAMAAHLEGKGASVLDFTGFAQKFGPVLSFVRLAGHPDGLNQVRIDRGEADALIGCDLVVSSSPQASATYDPTRTRAALNTTETPTADFLLNRDANLEASARIDAVADAMKDLQPVAANDIAQTVFGNTIYSNMLMLGFAWQHALVPVSFGAIMRAIELNGVQVADNRRAFAWGRLAAARPDMIDALPGHKPQPSCDETLNADIERRRTYLIKYQNDALAQRYLRLLARVRRAEARLAPTGSEPLTTAVADGYFRVLAYKDEYEVARLFSTPEFEAMVAERFEGDCRIRFHLAPPLISRGTDGRGRPRKRSFGRWIRPLFKCLARLKRLRGTPFDPFGYTGDRKLERALIEEYEVLVDRLLEGLDPGTHVQAAHIAGMIAGVRGYGVVKAEAAAAYRTQVAAALATYDTQRPLPVQVEAA